MKKTIAAIVPRIAWVVILPILSVSFVGTGCKAPLIPGYEVLPLPAGTNQYQAGTEWLPRIGTSGGLLAPVRNAPGLNQDFIDKTNQASLSLTVPLIKWLSGVLGLESKEVVVLQMTNLSHFTVSEAENITAPVLWETVVVSNFTFKIGQSRRANANVNVPLSQLVAGTSGNIQMAITNQSDGSHFLQANQPLVLAIRVVNPNQGVTEEKARLDLSDTAVGQDQAGKLGYRVMLQSPVDPFKKEANLLINNSSIPRFEGVNRKFQFSEPWISSSRKVIAGVDPKTRSVSYVWDKIFIQWDRDLSKCSLEITRQYTRFIPMKSGLNGTR